MGTVKSKRKLLELAKRSQLVAEDRIDDFVEALRAEDEATQPQDADQLADRLIKAGMLNRWQIDNLLKGKYKGFTLGKYKLLGHLGTGGMSSVYLAEHPVMERLVAIKVLPKRFVENPNYLERFKREARAVAALDHPNIVRAFDIDQDGDTHYIVMEYVDGRDLQKTVKEDGPLSAQDAMDFVAQAAQGLQHAHDAGLIHRDVKPANCLVDKQRCVKLLDLGLAMFSEDDRPSLSAKYDDSVVGTADYLAPEQARNSQNIDARADIYGLGCTLYFLLTGRPPFPDGSIAERLLKHQTQEPISLFELRPETPHAVVDLCRRMMVKDPDGRIQRAGEITDDVRNWLVKQGKSISFDRQYTANAPQTTSDSGWSRSSSGSRSNYPISTDSGIGRNVPGDTIHSSQHDDTARLGNDSSKNEDLTLAPIDESTRTTTGGSGLHDDDRPKPGSQSDEAAVDTDVASSSTIEELGLDHYGSGPLDALLEDPSFSKRVKLPKTQLSAKKPDEGTPVWVWILTAVLAVVLFGVMVLILLA